MSGAEVVHDLRACLGPDPGASGQLAREAGAGLRRGGSGRPAPGRIEAAPQPSEQIAYALGQLGRASRCLAEPEGDVRRQALRVLHPDRAPLDAQDAPRGVAELEDVAGKALDREILVE